MSLPLPWVERIFTKLTLVYGRRFLDQWAGLEMADVKDDWAHEMAGLQQSPKAITYGLQNLPEGKPPTVIEFRAACRRMPAENPVLLPHVRLDSDIVAGFVKKAQAAIPEGRSDSKEWARTIMARHEAGEKLYPICVKFAKEALAPRVDFREAA